MSSAHTFVLTVVLVATAMVAQAETTADPATSLLCDGREGCELSSAAEAGTDQDGNRLTVIELRFRDVRQVSWLHDGPVPDGECWPYPREFWVVVRKVDEVVAANQLLSLCTHSGEYGFSGVAEDSIEIRPNLLIHSRSGGSAWRWYTETGLRLSPLQTIFENDSGSWIHGPNWDWVSWNWETFSGRVDWSSPLCKYDSDGVLADDYPDAEEDSEELPTYSYWVIPQVEIDPASHADAWKRFALAACALAIESDGTQGFITHGKPGDKGDASMKVVMLSGREMLVEISDDLWVSDAKSWVFTDHLELWMGQRAGYMDHCIEKDENIRQWGIRLSDGRVFPAYGSPEDSPVAEVFKVPAGDGNRKLRLKLTLPEEATGVTVVYSDSDDGRTQERLIATSDLKFGRTETLGGVKEIPSDRARCEVIDDRLEVRLAEAFPPD